MLVLCPATVIDLLKTRDFCVPPFMKHPHQAAPATRYNRVIGEPRNPAWPGWFRLRVMGRSANRAAFFERLCGPTTIATGRFNLSH